MTKAQELLQEVIAELAPMSAQMRDHPYLIALEQGDIPRERLSAFVGEQHTNVETDTWSSAVIMNRCELRFFRRGFRGTLSCKTGAPVSQRAMYSHLGGISPFLFLKAASRPLALPQELLARRVLFESPGI